MQLRTKFIIWCLLRSHIGTIELGWKTACVRLQVSIETIVLVIDIAIQSIEAWKTFYDGVVPCELVVDSYGPYALHYPRMHVCVAHMHYCRVPMAALYDPMNITLVIIRNYTMHINSKTQMVGRPYVSIIPVRSPTSFVLNKQGSTMLASII